MPATPFDAKGLLKAAIRDDNPVVSSSVGCTTAASARFPRASTRCRSASPT